MHVGLLELVLKTSQKSCPDGTRVKHLFTTMITPSLRTDKDQQYPSLPRLLQFHYEHNPEQPLFIYDGHSDSDDLTEIKYLEFIRASHRASHLIRPPGSGVNRQVVAVVALLDTLVYTAVVAGLMQAGLVPLLISPRNTSAAVVDILKKSGAHRLLGTQSTLGELFQNIQAELASYKDNGKPYELVIEEIPSLTDLFPKLGVETAKDPFKPYPYPSSSYPGPEDIAAILHSSGSTGFPKPIPLNYRFLNKSWVISHSTKRFSQYGNPLGAYIPPFHVMAFVGTFLGPIYLGYTVTVYAPVVTHPRGLPTMPTPDNVLEHVRRTHCTACFSVPAMIQIWAQSPESIDVLRGLKLLVTAGGPIAQSTGDYLVSCGVPLRNIYGGTEFGACSNWSMEDDDKEDWAWHQFDPRTTKRWVPQGDGTFELQFLVCNFLNLFWYRTVWFIAPF
ncbi:hypothetical protein BDP27DRAFT_612166 [Rhodocollybia butyracea]|uniref:AMP-dependent synthetase/ligase domain-containing protein n=1 Tax=Rhodocollybia butyracea TaxID=206335 RepID=A0A9P5PYF7_9AGAR|nr:hypothetical protein BDP27DRAFT_612166 [Rhodocollybia butyracea]